MKVPPPPFVQIAVASGVHHDDSCPEPCGPPEVYALDHNGEVWLGTWDEDDLFEWHRLKGHVSHDV